MLNNSSFHKRKTLISLSVTAALLTIPQSLMAQQQSPQTENAEIERIVVESRGRKETIIEVPLSEKYFSSQEISDARIKAVDDFIGLTPGITIANSQDAGTNFITIRGVSQVRNGEPPVAVIVDGVLQTNARSFDQGLFDLESIEVLRGPQGALYGRNATQGAIIINTQKPTDYLEGYIEAGIGRGDEYKIEGSITGPISESVRFRVSGNYTASDGIFENVATGQNVGFKEELNLRGHLNFIVSDELQIDLRASYTDTTADALQFSFQGVTTDPTTGEVDGFTNINDSNVVQRRLSANNLGFDEREVSQLSLRVNYETDFGTLKAVTAYDTIDQSSGGDQFPYTANSTANPGLSFFDGTQTQSVDISTMSQDIRFVSNDDQAFRWMVGAYYLSTDRFIASTTGFDLDNGILPITSTPVLGGTINPTGTYAADDNENTAYAGYFNFAYDITEALEFSFAGRYDRDEREQIVDPQQGGYDVDGNLAFAIGEAGAVNKATFSHFQPKVSLRYLLSNDASIYTSWGEGFRSGQFNQNGVGVSAEALGLTGIPDVLDKEVTETFEIGFKADFLGGDLKTAGALFNTNVENAPFYVFVGVLGAQVLVGIEEVDITGGELEAAYAFTDELTGYLGYAYADSEVKEYQLDPTAVGNNAPYVPKSTINAGLQYRTNLTTNLDIFARADYESRGKQFWDPTNLTERDTVNLVNFGLGLEDVEGTWALTASVNNLFDEEYNAEYVTGGFAFSAPPAIWRLDFRYNFID
ncbi:TonB-dependent receptor [uncultured Paraglaciecola sp.]|uniref:TonB-dependent receptor n=1 Tax=uncultured Paraglaciecola sp. TaxID=1765024 RepID=UPI0030DBAFD5|tara:strand:- start:234733 stop:237003 length:2271 start_codon:yes stop_codon:yes gene_type:complete